MLRDAFNWTIGCINELFPRVTEAGLPGRPETSPRDWAPDNVSDYCPRCGASAPPEAVTPRGCPHCVKLNLPWQRVTRLGHYEDPLAEWIRQMKFHRQWTWGPWLGEQLAEVAPQPIDGQPWIVCPVPMHWRRRWVRGYNQAALIARSLAAARGWRYVDLLRAARPHMPQTTIAPSNRAANIRAAFDIEPVDLAGRGILLVDDVKTSGATLSLCTRLIKQSGAKAVQCAVAAVADPKGAGFKAR